MQAAGGCACAISAGYHRRGSGDASKFLQAMVDPELAVAFALAEQESAADAVPARRDSGTSG